jgi:hypothetical protein
VGRIRDGLQEIVSGVSTGATVAVTGQNRLSDGAAVVIQTSGTTDKENKPSLTKNRPSAVSQK